MTTPVTGQEGAAQDISGAVTSVIVRYVRARVGDYGLAQALAQAGELRPVQALEDPRGWSTHDEAIRLLAAASEVTGDPDIGRHVGEEMLRQHDGTDVADLLRSLGSPGELLRNVTAAAAKFTTVSTLEPLEVGEAHAVVRAVTRPGFIRHIYLCEFTKGLLSQVPVLFGLVPAVVTETECQARGGRFCLYSVAWEAGQWTSFVDDRSSLFSAAWGEQVVERPAELEVDVEDRVALLEEQLRQMSQRLEEVFSTASDLLAVEDLSELLARITRRAAQAVNAPKYLLVVRTEPGTRAELHQHGFADDEARDLAEELWLPEPDDADGSRLIVDIVSPRRRYGRLAAVYPPGMRFIDREREILVLYANYAAAALDMMMALAESRRSNDTTRALLEFSRSLAHIGTAEEVARILADTVPAVVGCDRSTVLLWDPFDQKLIFRAVSGGTQQTAPEQLPPSDTPIRFVAEEEIDLPEEEDRPPPFSTISPTDTDMVHQLMSSKDIVVVDRETADAFQLASFERYGTQVAVICPLYSDDEFLGVVAGDYLEVPAVDPREDPALQERLQALADQAVTSFQNAWLLEQVGHQAWHDALTGLPNRRLLEDRVVQELERAKRVDETSTMFFVDLDRFKRVNDTLGHSVGDELLKVVAQRLRDTVRRQDTVARLGGDEFAILLPGLSEEEDIRQLARRMIEILHEPYELERAEVLISASLGVAVSPQDGDTYDDLLSHADEAMYAAKQMGRNAYQLYSEVSRELVASLELRSRLDGVVDRGELFVEYQPCVKLATNRIVAVEAMVRWRHPERGILRPSTFLDLAEETNAIVKIDRFVIGEACRQMREWLDDGLPPLRISVNVSGHDLVDPKFVETVMDALRDNSIPSELCELELATNVLHDVDEDLLRNTLHRLQQIGMRFSIDVVQLDDATVAQLEALPLTTLKLDPSLLHGADDGALGEAALAVINLAAERELDSVAKGIETEDQLRLLTERGCTSGQGSLLSEPLDPADILTTVLDWPRGARVAPPSPPRRRPRSGAAPDQEAGASAGSAGEVDEEGAALEPTAGTRENGLAPEAEAAERGGPEEATGEAEAAAAAETREARGAPAQDELVAIGGNGGPAEDEGRLLEDLDSGVDPFEISPDVLAELGLDIPEEELAARTGPPEGTAAPDEADAASAELGDDPEGPEADAGATPRGRKKGSRSRSVPPAGPAF